MNVVSPSYSLVAILFVGCTSTGTNIDADTACWVPPLYKQFDVGLVRPTWEPKGRMLNQLPASDQNAKICWYGFSDGQVEARVNPSESGYMSHTFKRIGGKWALVDSHEEIVVH